MSRIAQMIPHFYIRDPDAGTGTFQAWMDGLSYIVLCEDLGRKEPRQSSVPEVKIGGVTAAVNVHAELQMRMHGVPPFDTTVPSVAWAPDNYPTGRALLSDLAAFAFRSRSQAHSTRTWISLLRTQYPSLGTKIIKMDSKKPRYLGT